MATDNDNDVIYMLRPLPNKLDAMFSREDTPVERLVKGKTKLKVLLLHRRLEPSFVCYIDGEIVLLVTEGVDGLSRLVAAENSIKMSFDLNVRMINSLTLYPRLFKRLTPVLVSLRDVTLESLTALSGDDARVVCDLLTLNLVKRCCADAVARLNRVIEETEETEDERLRDALMKRKVTLETNYDEEMLEEAGEAFAKLQDESDFFEHYAIEDTLTRAKDEAESLKTVTEAERETLEESLDATEVWKDDVLGGAAAAQGVILVATNLEARLLDLLKI